jgi:hypothetical protein
VTIEGAVEARNERGVKLDGEWHNVSKFKPIDLPEVGARIRAEVDAKGFLKSIEVLDARVAAATSSRERTIARLTVLKAAANFAAARTDIKSSDVLRIADLWLAWVETEDA